MKLRKKSLLKKLEKALIKRLNSIYFFTSEIDILFSYDYKRLQIKMKAIWDYEDFYDDILLIAVCSTYNDFIYEIKHPLLLSEYNKYLEDNEMICKYLLQKYIKLANYIYTNYK